MSFSLVFGISQNSQEYMEMEPKLAEPIVAIATGPEPEVRLLDSTSVKEPEFKALNNDLVRIKTSRII